MCGWRNISQRVIHGSWCPSGSELTSVWEMQLHWVQGRIGPWQSSVSFSEKSLQCSEAVTRMWQHRTCWILNEIWGYFLFALFSFSSAQFDLTSPRDTHKLTVRCELDNRALFSGVDGFCFHEAWNSPVTVSLPNPLTATSEQTHREPAQCNLRGNTCDAQVSCY